MKYTNKYNLPQSLVDVILGKTFDLTQADPNRIGVTTLINPPRQRLLTVKHWHELEEDVSNHIWRITGNAYHYILAKTNERNRLIEKKIIRIVDGITIVGKLDIYDTGLIEDYKITSVWGIKLGNKKDWEEQLNCYAWLLRKSGFAVTGAFVNAILRDWSKSELKRYGKDYPPIPFARVKIKLWSFQKQEQFIRNRIAIYKAAKDLPEEKLPVCSPEERWSKEAKWAVYKGNNKTASRVLDTPKQAKGWIKDQKESQTYKVTKRPAIDTKCMEYCLVNKFCSYWKKNYGIKQKVKK